MVAAHKPGAFKQKNKTHKHGRHKTKGMLDQKTKGRVANGPKGGSKALGLYLFSFPLFLSLSAHFGPTSPAH